MNQTAEDMYRVIGQTLARCAPANWTSVWAKAEIGEGSGVTEFDYETASTTRTWFEPPNQDQYAVYQAFKGIKEAMVAAKQPSWRSALFTLERSGKFNLHFDYE
jgi:hypothetical protein